MKLVKIPLKNKADFTKKSSFFKKTGHLPGLVIHGSLVRSSDKQQHLQFVEDDRLLLSGSFWEDGSTKPPPLTE